MIYVNARAIIERCNNDITEIVIQTRNKPGDSGRLELPGGQVKMFESLLDAVKREVLEETGLELIEIDGESSKVNSSITNGSFVMECVKPYAVYQTVSGPVDSMGVYFKCKAKGKLEVIGDCTLNAKWIDINELNNLVHNNPQLFSEIDLAGIIFYLNDKLKVNI